jgi:hypothetical protein
MAAVGTSHPRARIGVTEDRWTVGTGERGDLQDEEDDKSAAG